MFKKISIVLLSFIYFNSTFAAGGAGFSADDYAIKRALSPSIEFEYKDPERGVGLSINIFASPTGLLPALHIRSVQAADIDQILALYTDPEVMAKYMDGKPRAPERIRAVMETNWLPKLDAGNPFVVFPVFNTDGFSLKDDTKVPAKTFLGLVGLATDSDPESALLFGMGFKHLWGNGLASHVAQIILECFVPELVDRGFKLNNGDKVQDLKFVNATARPDNPGSLKILQHYYAGKEPETVVEYGAERRKFRIPVEALRTIRDAKRMADGGAGTKAGAGGGGGAATA